MPYKDPAKQKASKRPQRRRNYQRRKAAGLCVNCGSASPGRDRLPGKLICRICENRWQAAHQRYWQRLIDAAFAAYGGARCICCGETEKTFLTIDHINGGGSRHRRQIAAEGQSNSIYIWLKRHNYPAGFQVLCQNCNLGRFRNGGECPHQSKRQSLLSHPLLKHLA